MLHSIRKSRFGFTLVELMVVCALIAIILGISTALLTNFNKKIQLESTLKDLSTFLKEAQTFALQSQNYVQIECNISKQYLQSVGEKIQAYWHFESLPASQDYFQNLSIAKGKIGKSIQFTFGKSIFKSHRLKYMKLGKIFSISFWLYLQRIPTPSFQTICKIGFCKLKINSDYMLVLSAFSHKKVIPFQTVLYKWIEIKIQIAPDHLSLIVNRIPRIDISFSIEQDIEEYLSVPLQFGPYFQGRVDELCVSSLIILKSFYLPSHIRMIQAPSWIVLDPYGHINSFQSTGPLSIVFQEKVRNHPTKKIIAKISYYGKIESFP